MDFNIAQIFDYLVTEYIDCPEDVIGASRPLFAVAHACEAEGCITISGAPTSLLMIYQDSSAVRDSVIVGVLHIGTSSGGGGAEQSC